MIQLNEVRIGNFLIFDNKIEQITCIEKYNEDELLSFTINEDRNIEQWKCYEFYPIPLTPEILEKAGFKTFADGMLHIDGMNTWRLEFDAKEGAAFWCTDIYPELGHRIYLPTRMEYVHQLQNEFFYLFSKELEIVL